jgi:hypothetical protein
MLYRQLVKRGALFARTKYCFTGPRSGSKYVTRRKRAPAISRKGCLHDSRVR